MSQKGFANSIKAAIIGMGICGLVVYFYFLPMWGKTAVAAVPEYTDAYIPWMIFLWITAIPCYLVLVCGWRIATEIGKDNSFSTVNAKLLKYVAALAAFDTVFLFIGSSIFYVLNMCTSILMLMALIVSLAGVAIIIVAAAASHLVYKAAAMKEENELTI